MHFADSELRLGVNPFGDHTMRQIDIEPPMRYLMVSWHEEVLGMVTQAVVHYAPYPFALRANDAGGLPSVFLNEARSGKNLVLFTTDAFDGQIGDTEIAVAERSSNDIAQLRRYWFDMECWATLHPDAYTDVACPVEALQFMFAEIPSTDLGSKDYLVKFLTLVYQINDGIKRLLWVAEDRKEESLSGFFDWLGAEQSAKIEFVCTDMWKPFLAVIAKCIPNAVNVLDRFHIKAKLNKAVDEVRAKETKELAKKGLEPVLKHSRFCFLKRKENLTGSQAIKLKSLLSYNLKTVKAYLIACQFDFFWTYKSHKWAEKFLISWCAVAMRSRLTNVLTKPTACAITSISFDHTHVYGAHRN